MKEKKEEMVIGERETEKLLRKGQIKKIILAKNAKEDLIKRMKRYQEIYKINVEISEMDNEEIGIKLKKPFKVMVVGIKSNKSKSKK